MSGNTKADLVWTAASSAKLTLSTEALTSPQGQKLTNRRPPQKILSPPSFHPLNSPHLRLMGQRARDRLGMWGLGVVFACGVTSPSSGLVDQTKGGAISKQRSKCQLKATFYNAAQRSKILPPALRWPTRLAARAGENPIAIGGFSTLSQRCELALGLTIRLVAVIHFLSAFHSLAEAATKWSFA